MNRLALATSCAVLLSGASVPLFAQSATTQPATQPAGVQYLSPADVVPKGSAPGAKAKLVSDVDGRKTYALILKQGDEVFTALADFAKQYDVKAAHYTAIGALTDVQVGWYDLKRRLYKVIPIDGQVEAVSVMGDIGVLASGKPMVHTHVVVSLPDGTTRGGHLIHAITSPTLEIIITVEPTPLKKKADDASGLSLFDPVE